MDLQLAGRTGLVTGASAGIGRETAQVLAREGVRLVVHGRRADRLNALADEIAAEGGVPPTTVIADIVAEGAVNEIAGRATAALGHIDILVNNAGGTRPFVLQSTDAEWHEALMLNFECQRRLTHLLVGDMATRGWGRVINVTGKSEPESINGAAAAKAATHAWAKGLSREVGRQGVTVNCVAPGHIETEQIGRLHTDAYRERQIRDEIPLGRYGTPADLAHLIAFLASPLANYLTGTVIPVDGGLRRYQF